MQAIFCLFVDHTMLNDFQQNLYNDMMKLVELGNDAFYFKDHTILETYCFRVFNYRLASYTEFCLPSALECRGIMFQIDPVTKQPFCLACMMPEKFFNRGEMSGDINTLCEALIRQGRLSQDVYERAKARNRSQVTE